MLSTSQNSTTASMLMQLCNKTVTTFVLHEHQVTEDIAHSKLMSFTSTERSLKATTPVTVYGTKQLKQII